MTMRWLSRILAFVMTGLLLSLPVLGADDKDKKSDAKKEEPAKKTDVKKDEAKKDDAKKDDAKKEDSKKESDKGKEAPAEKLYKLTTVRGKIVWRDESKKKLKIQIPVDNDKNVEYEWQAIDEVKVRSMYAPMQFDEKGRARKPTPKELKELRGTDKLPGYQADFSDLKDQQVVDVTLVTKKKPPRTPPKKGTLGEEYTPKMSLIIIVSPLNP
jgi:hypothetical protein